MVSARYSELTLEDAKLQYMKLRHAWTSASIPAKQRDLVLKELDDARAGKPCPTYKVAIDCLRKAPVSRVNAKVLDVGAGCAHYGELLKVNKIGWDYTACDYSENFKAVAETMFPGIRYDVAEATKLPYGDESFDVVLSSALLMHVMEWRDAIKESVRVSREWVFFHRTPFVLMGPTRYYCKEAYGVPCVEIHFSEAEVFAAFREAGLKHAHTQTIFQDGSYGHRSYLFRKG